jgi:Leucine-rich repeat (LRR) protein
MKTTQIKLAFFGTLLLLITTSAAAQPVLTAQEIEQYSEDARQMVSYLEKTFNTLGNPKVSVKDKDIIINQSWAKIFVDAKVQIEDDLDENREVPINKDVQAYLKDIDFFFNKVVFKFDIEKIEQQINEKNELFFKITLNRNLRGSTINGDSINSNRLRYIEINLTDTDKDLKIASIYTTRLNEKEELRNWWNELPIAWKELFGSQIALSEDITLQEVLFYDDSIVQLKSKVQRRMSRDTMSFALDSDTLTMPLTGNAPFKAVFIDRQIKKIFNLDTINISGNTRILSLEPLSRLTSLRRIDCSRTFVEDLMPLRNHIQLEYLNCGSTSVASLEPLKYTTRLEILLLNNTLVDDLSAVQNFKQLRQLNFSSTPVADMSVVAGLPKLGELELISTQVRTLAPLQSVTSLERLDFSETTISDLSPLKGLNNLRFLKFDHTPVADLLPLQKLERLQIVFADQTGISNLEPLADLPHLSRIYCDQSGVTRAEAIAFMNNNPEVLVIYESTNLESWWKNLTPAWKTIFKDAIGLQQEPAKEELHQMSRIKNLSVAGNEMIRSLEPLTALPMLYSLEVQGTAVSSLEPLADLGDLHEINFSDTPVEDLQPLQNLTKLEKLSFDRTPVKSIVPIMSLEQLTLIYADNTKVPDEEMIEFTYRHPKSLAVYQTPELMLWWEKLPAVWKLLAEKFIHSDENLSREQLQTLVNLRSIRLSDMPALQNKISEIRNLEFIDKFLLLEELSFSNTSITSLEPLRGMTSLKILTCANNPIESLEPLSEVPNLEVLDVQNTPIESLEYLAPLTHLRKLNCSGTMIRKLKGLQSLSNLEQLDCYNTSIRNLNDVQGLSSIKLIRCYNTRISQRHIDKFKAKNPQVEVVFY